MMSERPETADAEQLESFFLHPGYIYASRESLFLNTVLGSCVAVALWDSRHAFGGMCHFMYPYQRANARNARYGDVALPYLVRLLQELGANQQDLLAHVVGGGINRELGSTIGDANARVAEELLVRQGIELITLDVGGNVGKKISFNTSTGELLVYTTTRIRDDDWYK